jgi:DNA-binding MarR family transcriptional regulator
MVSPSLPPEDLSNTPALEFLQSLWRLNHALERLSGRMETALGVTAQQRLIIRWIGAYPGIVAGELAQVLHLDRGTVSASLKRLEAKGIIERRQDKEDRRRMPLHLTRKGKGLNRPTEGTAEHAVVRLLRGKHRTHTQSTREILEELAALLDQELGDLAHHPEAEKVPRRAG